MSIYQEVALRSIPIDDLATKGGPSVGIFVGTGGDDIVVELVHDPDGTETTFPAPVAGSWLPISIKKWVSGPADSVILAV